MPRDLSCHARSFRRPSVIAALAFALVLATPALAADYAEQADAAVAEQRAAVTIFVDADWGRREDSAAAELTRAHAAFAARGYRLVDVESYLENGDLQGFFVSYQRITP